VLVARARYFASMLDQATVGCFLEHQVIRLSSRKSERQLPEVDRQSSYSETDFFEGLEHKAKVDCSFDSWKNSFDSFQVYSSWLVHE
jgi:hypothetical protein